jgi:hypothetical protein
LPPNPYPPGTRELNADFAGVKSANLTLLKRPDALTFDYLTAFTLGPQNIGDTLSSIIDRPWYVRADNMAKKVYTARANDANTAWEAEVELFSFVGADIEEIDVAFEQASRPVVCAERNTGLAGAKEVWLYWYNPFTPGFEFVKFDSGRTPRVLLDNPPDITRSDIQLFYLKEAQGLVYRQQRDAYAIVITTPHVDYTDWYLEDVFYTHNWRVGLVLVKHNVDGSYTKKRMETSLMPLGLITSDIEIQPPEFDEGELRIGLQYFDAGVEKFWIVHPEYIAGELRSPIVYVGGDQPFALFEPSDEFKMIHPDYVTGELRVSKFLAEPLDDGVVMIAPAFNTGVLYVALIQHTTYDQDKMQMVHPQFISGSLGP